MKFKMTRKKMAILVLLVIIVPIVYNKLAGTVMGLIQRQAMMQPKEVVVNEPQTEEVNISVESTGSVEA